MYGKHRADRLHCCLPFWSPPPHTHTHIATCVRGVRVYVCAYVARARARVCVCVCVCVCDCIYIHACVCVEMECADGVHDGDRAIPRRLRSIPLFRMVSAIQRTVHTVHHASQSVWFSGRCIPYTTHRMQCHRNHHVIDPAVLSCACV